jgi:pterin-4a-carbinolamine dehydratase
MSKSSNQQQTPVTVIGDPDPAGLKAERIQEAIAIGVDPKGVTRLKAERIQLGLQGLPGWTLQRGGITRTVEIADQREVSHLLQYVAELVFDGEMPELHVRRGQVTFVLPLVDDGYLDKPLFEMAQTLAAGN